MDATWIKRILPRGLYGRAALILILPIVVLQLVVSTVFLQRHYEGVTRQMTSNLNFEIAYLLDGVEAAPNATLAQSVAAARSAPLNLIATLPSKDTIGSRRALWDLSGKAMVETLKGGLEGVAAVDFRADPTRVHMAIETRHGVMRLEFDRARVSASNPHQLLVWMIFTGILMTLIAIVFLRNQLRPIRRLASAATDFGKGSATSYRPKGATEVRQAGNAFLEMRARIERQIEQRTLMLSGVSHDLRTPLTRFRLGVSMLEENADVEALKRDISDMEDLLNSFLDFARGEATEDHAEINPVALARSAVDKARRSGAEVEFLATEASLIVKLRPMAIERALNNLIGNALRYGSRARVSVDIYEKAVRFRVEDDGPGIPPGEREAAFRAFARLDPGRNQDRGAGVGLGLTITADIARSHGGTLCLSESTALGGLQADLVVAR